jgi:hypothetical protein
MRNIKTTISDGAFFFQETPEIEFLFSPGIHYHDEDLLITKELMKR